MSNCCICVHDMEDKSSYRNRRNSNIPQLRERWMESRRRFDITMQEGSTLGAAADRMDDLIGSTLG